MRWTNVFAPLVLLCLWCSASSAAEYRYRWLLEEPLQEEDGGYLRGDVTGPQERVQALEAYHRGEFRTALPVLERLASLQLPDGELDFVRFALAETYRMLGLEPQAREWYRRVIADAHGSNLVPPALYRLISSACAARRVEEAESLFTVFHLHNRAHPLYASVVYKMGLLYYDEGRYGEGYELLTRIDASSQRHLQAQFVAALCHIELKQWDKALLLLQYVRDRGSANPSLRNEAALVIGDIYYLQENTDAALRFYAAVPSSSVRYPLARLKSARANLDASRFEAARTIANDFIGRRPDSDIFFEMATILERAYTGLGDEENAHAMGAAIHRQLTNARLAFDVLDELDLLAAARKSWQLIDFEAIRSGDDALRRTVARAIADVDRLRDAAQGLLTDLDGKGEHRDRLLARGRAELRYLAMIRDSMQTIRDSLVLLQGSAPPDSSAAIRDSVRTARLHERLADYEQEHELVVTYCLEPATGRTAQEVLRQIRYVDWAFMHYQELKKRLVYPPAAAEPSDASRLFAAAQQEQQAQSVQDERERLAEHIDVLLSVFPVSPSVPSLLMRLAELHFDEASERFGRQLRHYEEMMAAGAADTLPFPEYELDATVALYERIADEHPDADVADNALFYQALALQRMGLEEEAAVVLERLTVRYPESGFYVEANMRIGRYYFDNPGYGGGKGYDMAEAAFRKVLYYREHPQFVQALYHLGWCYYMKDRFEEAIAVFRYLVEEVHLDFDPGQSEEKQIANPLLREEAIDYIAISFDEEGRMDDAITFLQLIGNIDYASMVLLRVGELREEDLDYHGAVRMYHQLIAEYPASLAAPQAAVSLMRLYESARQPDEALREREKFFERYARGGEWQTAVIERDSAAVRQVDSLALALGLYVGDSYYRGAQEQEDPRLYRAAAASYQRTVRLYPDELAAAPARWNLAIILDRELNERPAAYTHYLEYAAIEGGDNKLREQAVLNAIAIAQSLLAPDSLVQEGTIEMAAVKLIEAAERYVTLFPDGEERSTVRLAEAAVFFNRKMFANAARVYEDILAHTPGGREHFEAAFLLGQCHFGEENWRRAAARFDYVWKHAPDGALQEQAYKLLLQSWFLDAKAFAQAGDHGSAAAAFLAIEQRYPGSEYSDIVLFNAAEMYEKKGDDAQAVATYQRLVDRYPLSRLAPDALYNAAAVLERAEMFARVAGVYETLVADYPESERARDALFNLGFVYEKLNRPDKMAEANERYTLAYPGEEDVEVMLLRSGEYYVKAQMFDRALNAYLSFERRFPSSPGVVQALYMTGRIHEMRNEHREARERFAAAESANRRLAAAGGEANDYYAAEAAFRLASLFHRKMMDVPLVLPEKVLMERRREKTELVAEAVKGYERVVRYRSERMFEAAYQSARIYDDLAQAWFEQERPRLDPARSAVYENTIASDVAALLQQSIVAYRATLDIAARFDTLSSQQEQWIGLAREGVGAAYYRAGKYLLDAAALMHHAPVPKEIQNRILHSFQYQKTVLETIEPLKIRVRDHFLSAWHELREAGLEGTESRLCLNQFNELNFRIANDYDLLAQTILERTRELPASMDPIEREDLLFQMEDIVFELQDKALYHYQEARQRSLDNEQNETPWHRRILEGLAHLNPELYGAEFYAQGSFASDEGWIVRADSIANWNSERPSRQGWRGVVVAVKRSPGFPGGYVVPGIVPADTLQRAFFWLHAPIHGQPRDGSIHISSPHPYRLYINGALTLADTAREDGAQQLDSAVGIVSLLKPGSNIVGIEVRSREHALQPVAVLLTFMYDSTARYSLLARMPDVPVVHRREGDSGADSVTPASDASPMPVDTIAVPRTYRTRGEALNALAAYTRRHEESEQALREEHIDYQRLRMTRDAIDAQVDKLREEIDELRKTLELE